MSDQVLDAVPEQELFIGRVRNGSHMPPSFETDIEPPETRREVVSETFHGYEIADPYRWLEDSSERVGEWTARQNEYTDRILQTPVRDRLRPKLEEVGDTTTLGPLLVRGGRYFQQIERAHQDHATLSVRETVSADPTVIVNPNTWAENQGAGRRPVSMGWFLPSPDGEYVACGVTEGGDEQYDIYVRSVPDGTDRAILAGVGRVDPATVGWQPDNRGLYYIGTGKPGAGRQLETELRCWSFTDGTEAVHEYTDPTVSQLIRIDPDSGTVAMSFFKVGGGYDWYVLVGDHLRPVLTNCDAKTELMFWDGRVYLRTNHEAPRFRVLGCTLERFRAGDLSFGECEPVIRERDAILQSVVPTADHLVVHFQEDAHSSLAVFDPSGEYVSGVRLPPFASVTHLEGNRLVDEVFYRVTSFADPPTVVREDLDGGDRETVASVDVEAPDDVTVRQEFVHSTNDADVPMFICHRKGLDLDGTDATVLYGYGGFRKTMEPSFDRFRIPFLASGGVYAQVCARGGHAYGEEWHEAGMRENKQQTFDDFIAAGEFLCETGYTSPDKLVVAGGSNGGLSVGAVVTQRPSLWAGAVCKVPLLDMLRFHRFFLGELWTTEYGPPTERETFEYLRAYSPYHNVSPAESYPPILITTGEDDTLVHPAHARKMVARLQNEASGGPFLLRTIPDTGHGVGKPTSVQVTEQVDKWSFITSCVTGDFERVRS